MSMYARLEELPTTPKTRLTVAYLEQCEAHGEPWPISGDLAHDGSEF